MSKPYLVVFTPNNARVEKTPHRILTLRQYPGAMYCPDLSEVRGVPPHFWKKGEDNKVVKMTEGECFFRSMDIAARGPINNVNMGRYVGKVVLRNTVIFLAALVLAGGLVWRM